VLFEELGLTVEDVTGYDALTAEQKTAFIETGKLPIGAMQALIVEKQLGNICKLERTGEMASDQLPNALPLFSGAIRLTQKDDLTTSAPSSAQAPVICSFFAGAGFLDLGFETAGFEIAYVNEFHSPFIAAYKFSRKKMGLPEPTNGYFEGDIEACADGEQADRLSKIVNAANAENRLIGFIGGPPCPDFSVGGKNKGQHGSNGRLSMTYIKLITTQKPDFFVFENVKGLYRTAKHREFFDGLKKELAAAGYACTEKLVNALDYGVPQDRERIILFGIRNADLKKHIDKFDWLKHQTHVEPKLSDWPQTCDQSGSRIDNKLGIRELTVQHWFEKNDVNAHPNAAHQFKPRAGLEKFQTLAEGDDSKKSYKRLHRWRYSPTAAYGNNEVHIHPWLPRRISVAEALAVQSMPKNFALPPDMTLTNMFKTIGNGVPYLAAKGIALTIQDFLRSSNNEANGK
jgi:DNA (cytosine-5)-methyltransferase 1